MTGGTATLQIFFESDRDGSWDIFKQGINQHSPESLAASPSRREVRPQLTPDGFSVLCAAGIAVLETSCTLQTDARAARRDGTSMEVPIGGPLDEFRCGLGGRCVLRTTVGRQYYNFRELDPIRGAGRELARHWRGFRPWWATQLCRRTAHRWRFPITIRAQPVFVCSIWTPFRINRRNVNWIWRRSLIYRRSCLPPMERGGS